MKISLFLYPLFLAYFLIPAYADSDPQAKAESALLQGDSELAAEIIKTPNCKLTKACLEIEVLYFLAIGEIDVAIDLLNGYQERYSHAAQTHAFAAEVWRSIGHQVNIFRKRTYYRKALQAKFRAGLGESAPPRYRVLRASAFGQEGDIATQRKLTADIVANDDKWGLIAQINLAQNTDDFDWGTSIVAKAIASYPQDFFINERVAQFYWTINRIADAQQHFLAACKSAPNMGWFDRKKWLDTCLLVVQFSDQYGINHEATIIALNHILAEHNLLTSDNLEYAKLLMKVSSESGRSTAIAFLQRVIMYSDDTTLVDEAAQILAAHE